MSNYSRQNKETNKDSQETGKASHHIKKGLSAFQKILTLIGSMLGIITATITISNAMKSNEQKKADTSPVTQTTIIKEIQKETPAENNDKLTIEVAESEEALKGCQIVSGTDLSTPIDPREPFVRYKFPSLDLLKKYEAGGAEALIDNRGKRLSDRK